MTIVGSHGGSKALANVLNQRDIEKFFSGPVRYLHGSYFYLERRDKTSEESRIYAFFQFCPLGLRKLSKPLHKPWGRSHIKLGTK